MDIRRADQLSTRLLTEFDSDGVVTFIAFGGAHVVRMELRSGGRIGRHPAATDQVMIVLEGAGTVNGVVVSAGDVVRWAQGEEHETVSERGLVALVVEAAGLEIGDVV
jgi:quercetin dioxygenase-like cupin family protein